MALSIICIHKGSDRDAFIRDAQQANVVLLPVEGLPRHFMVDGVSPRRLPAAIKKHPFVHSIDDGEKRGRGDSTQSFTMSSDLENGSWSIARIIRRQAPWNVDRIKLPLDSYFRCVRDGSGVDIYMIDSGIRTTHDEFGGRATNVYEAVSSGGLGDDQSHGTGTTSAACGDTVGIARGALAWSFKVLDSTNSGTNTDLVLGLGQALSHYQGRSGTNRPAVVNMSLGGFGSTVNSAVSDLIDAGMVVLATAGNTMEDLGSITHLPAESDADVIIVAGSGMADIPYYTSDFGSSYGTPVDVIAPSQTCWLATNTSDSAYTRRNGTSFGCAYASGVVACMLQGHNRLNNRTKVQAVKAKLIANATTGKIRNNFGLTLPDAMLYLDPNQTAPETISGL